jgi:hypothetical protein
MDKIWILKSKYSWKLCKSENELLKRIGKNSTVEVLQYELKSNQEAKDYLLSRERDLQLRSVLGELTDFEKKSTDLISVFENLAPIGKVAIHVNRDNGKRYETSEKDSWVTRLKKFQDNEKAFKGLLVDNKEYFLQVSNSTEWLCALLKCHNFIDCKIIKGEYNKELKRSIYKDLATEELKAAFLLAKEMNKKKKKK